MPPALPFEPAGDLALAQALAEVGKRVMRAACEIGCDALGRIERRDSPLIWQLLRDDPE